MRSEAPRSSSVNAGKRVAAAPAARSIRTPWLDRWAGHEDELAGRFAEDREPGHEEGSDSTPAYAGPIAGMITEQEPAQQIVTSVVNEAANVLKSSRAFLSS